MNSAEADRVTPLRQPSSGDGINEAAFEALKQLINHEAEQALLGAILVNNRSYDTVCDFLAFDDFAHPLHGEIYAAVGSIIAGGAVANPITLAAYFAAADNFLAQGGRSYLALLAESAVSIINARHYGVTIRDLARRRELVATASELIQDAGNPKPERVLDQVIDEIEHRLYLIAERGLEHRAPRAAAVVGRQVVTDTEEAYKAGGAVIVDTGLKELDDIIRGLGAGELVVLAGRPSMGESVAAGTIAFNVAKTGKHPMFFSLEMTAEELGQRWLAGLSSITTDQLRHGKLDMLEWPKLLEAEAYLGALPIIIDDQPRLSVMAIRQRARRQRRRGGLDLIIIDHLQQIRQGGRQESRRLEIGDATSSLKSLAKDLGVPVLLVSQINRKVEERDDKRPNLSDLKESGDIEQDADVVLFLFREEYYLTKSPLKKRGTETHEAFASRQADWEAECDRVRGIAEIAVAKNRHGRTGLAKVRFDAERQRFENLSKWEHSP